MQCKGGGDAAIFVMEPLPYSQDAMAPHLSAQTMGFHYDKHYAGYVKKANALTKEKGYAGKTVEAVIKMTAGDTSKAAVFNNAAQAWNHAYFFKCLKPQGGGPPEGQLAEMIDTAFGSFADFEEVFLTAAKSQFGSGWAWLVLDEGELVVISCANADTPLAHDLTPLFTVDVWEHAYYLDYQNRRADYVKTVLDNLANWDFVAEQLKKALPAKA
jgi:Fe-Mn family superoxide dismutase